MWTATVQSKAVTSGSHDVITMLDSTTPFALQQRKTALPKQGKKSHSCFTFSSVETKSRNNRVKHTEIGSKSNASRTPLRAMRAFPRYLGGEEGKPKSKDLFSFFSSSHKGRPDPRQSRNHSHHLPGKEESAVPLLPRGKRLGEQGEHPPCGEREGRPL